MDIAKAKCPNCERSMSIKSMVCGACDIKIDAPFELSRLARLSPEDQEFVVAFVGSHGSIKQMESVFNISYPTVKNRLSALAKELGANDTGRDDSDSSQALSTRDVLRQVEHGDMNIDDALALLKK